MAFCCLYFRRKAKYDHVYIYIHTYIHIDIYIYNSYNSPKTLLMQGLANVHDHA
jgi:hypothetical protein